MSRCAATRTTRWRGPAGVSTIPSGWKSSTALLSGIGTWSCAWKVTAAASSFSSVTGGSSSVRSTVRWLATPTRTRLLRPVLVEQLAQHLAERAVVGDFAVAHRVRSEWTHLGALGQDRAVHARLDGSDETRLNVQSNHLGAAAATEASSEVEVQLGDSW